MSFSSLDLNFKTQSLEDWREAARQELDGNEPFEKLHLKKGSLSIKPYYVAQTGSEKNFISPLPPSAQPFLGARSWHNAPKVAVTDATQANQEILNHLNHGADGVLIEITNDQVTPEAVFDQVQLPYCSVSFQVNLSAGSFLGKFKAFAEKKFNRDELSGSIFFADPKNANGLFREWPRFKSIGIIVSNPSTDPTEAIAQAMAEVVSASEIHRWDKSYVSQVAFQLPVGTDFFLEMAKIQALKHLWAGVAHAYGVNLLSPVFVHAYSPAWTAESFEPHGNLLKQTTAGLSAVLGGCDALTLEPDSKHPVLTSRIARNVSSMLREESHLAQVGDPIAGAYYLHHLTEQLITETWKKFQTLMS